MRHEDFFAFIREREQIRLRKEADLPYPWTEDPILRAYKFTNVQRHHDRTSRELINTFYAGRQDWDPVEILMNAALFRYFGTYEFARAIGWQDYLDFDFEGIKELASQRLAKGERVFTGAYVITNQGISAPKQEVVVDCFLRPLHARAPKIVKEVPKGWKAVAQMMSAIQGFGGSGFMTKETLLDTTYTRFWGGEPDPLGFTYPSDWMEWTPIGPGARRGAARVMGHDDQRQLKEKDSFDVIMDLLSWSRSLWPNEWDDLNPHNIQFQLCEFDKYERVRLGQGKPRSIYRAPK